MLQRSLSKYRPYLVDVAIAVIVVTIAGCLRFWPLDMLGTRVPYLTFYPAIVIVALLGSWVSGLLATVLSLVFLCLIFPGYIVLLYGDGDLIALTLFTFSALLITFLGENARQLRDRKQQADLRVQQFSTALDHITAYIYIKDRQHRYVYANRKTLELFHRTPEDLVGSGDAEFFPPETVQHLYEVDRRVMELGEQIAEEIIVPLESGGSYIYWEVKSPIYDDQQAGTIIGLCGISTDITQQKQRETELRESMERFRATFDSAAIGMALVNTDGRFMQVNDALCDLVGYNSAQLTKMTYQDITHADDLQTDMNLVRELVEGKRERYHMEKRYIHKDGHPIWILLSVAKVMDASGKVLYFIAQIQDINQQKALIEALKVQARHDALTGLNNRGHFLSLCESELQRASRFETELSVLMLDIDHFKKINDAYGHKAGDMVLVKLAEIMRQTLRNIDVIGRYGGEEFAILLPGTDGQLALEVAQRLRQVIASSNFVMDAGMPLKITVSIGVSSSLGEQTNIDIMINAADQALYRAKNAGRNKVMAAESL